MGFSIMRSGSDSQLTTGYRSDLAGGSWVMTATYGSTGSYSPITFRTSDTNQLTIATSGYVGIGTTSPTANLHIAGGSVFSQGSWPTAPQLRLIGTGSNDAIIYFGTTSNARAIYVDESDSNKLKITGGGATDLVTIDNSGNVGIGTTSPGSKLELANSSSVYTRLNADNASNYTLMGKYGTDSNSPPFFLNGAYAYNGLTLSTNSWYNTVAWQTPISTTAPSWALRINSCGPPCGAAGDHFEISRAAPTSGTPSMSTLFYINSSGNVGIGTTGPGSRLEVSGPEGTPSLSADSGIITLRGNTVAGGVTLNFGTYNGTPNYATWIQAAYTTSASTEPLAIQPLGGSVGIGTATPGQKLDVAGTIRQTGGVNCALATNSSGDILCSSDERLKDVKGYYTGSLDVVDAIDPVRFNFKGETYEHVGFSAQNVQKVLPEATPQQKDGYLGFDSSALLAVSVNAIKDLKSQIVDLKNGVAKFVHLVADLVTAPKVQTDELEMKDSATGQVYCVTIRNGDWNKTPGTCPD